MEKHGADACIFRVEYEINIFKVIKDRLLRNILSKVIHEIVVKFDGTFTVYPGIPYLKGFWLGIQFNTWMDSLIFRARLELAFQILISYEHKVTMNLKALRFVACLCSYRVLYHTRDTHLFF